MKRLAILVSVSVLLLLAAPAPPADAAVTVARARRLHEKWQRRLGDRRTRYIGVAGRLSYWERTLERRRRTGASSSAIAGARDRKQKLARKERRVWKRVREAQRKVERFAELKNRKLAPAALRRVMPTLGARTARKRAKTLGEAMSDYRIANRQRAAMFVAQIAHESGELRYTREIWVPTAAQLAYAHILGNNGLDDAFRYRGGGYIQLTGKSNYRAAARGTGLPLVKKPGLLDRPRHAAEVSAWWWRSHGLNPVADTGDFVRVTQIINGGTNGLASRQLYHGRARAVAAGLVPKAR